MNLKPICPRCGEEETKLLRTEAQPELFRLRRDYKCKAGHRFETLEVPPTMLSQNKQQLYTAEAIGRRIALAQRDLKIKSQNKAGVSSLALSKKYSLSRVRIHQILSK